MESEIVWTGTASYQGTLHVGDVALSMCEAV
jgi:hypothetical protein